MSKITLRTLAVSCGVSAATVSRALSGHPNVRPAVRTRVQAAAQAQGYTPNQLVGSVMAHVRAARTQTFHGNLAIVFVPSAEQSQPMPMQVKMIASAEVRARELGFTLGSFRLDPPQLTAEILGRVLRARGVQGVVFIHPRQLTTIDQFPFAHFASVAIDYASPTMVQHSVSIDHYATLSSALNRLQGLGYAQVGLFIEGHKDERIMFKWTAAFRSYQEARGGIGRIPVLKLEKMTAPKFLAWHRQHRPDLVLGHVDKAVAWLRSAGCGVPSHTGYFNLNWNERTRPCAGLELRPELQGKVAVESLVAQIHRNERGLPADPQTITLRGEWVDGPTIRSLLRAAAEPRAQRK